METWSVLLSLAIILVLAYAIRKSVKESPDTMRLNTERKNREDYMHKKPRLL
jgi:hypothetical protein